MKNLLLLRDIADMLESLPTGDWRPFTWTGDAIGNALRRLDAVRDTGLHIGERGWPVRYSPKGLQGGYTAIGSALGLSGREATELFSPRPDETPHDVAARILAFIAECRRMVA